MELDLDFQTNDVENYVKKALKPSWIYQELPWHDYKNVDNRLYLKDVPTLIDNLPEFKLLSENQKNELKYKESIYHLGNLMAGEHKAVALAGDALSRSPKENPYWIHAITTIISDETKHFVVLNRYLQEKLKVAPYKTHPRINSIFRSLISEDAFEVKLFVAQVVLEWTATSLLSSMLFKKPEPLFTQIVKRILQDECRHLAFSRLSFDHLHASQIQEFKTSMEDLLFEAIVAVISSFCAIPVWQEFGFSRQSCQRYAIQELVGRGVIDFYSKVIPTELERCHIKSDRLVNLLKKDLINQITQDHWTFEPEIDDSLLLNNFEDNGETYKKVKKVFEQVVPVFVQKSFNTKTSLVTDLHIDSLKVAELSILLEQEFEKSIFLPDWITSIEDPKNLTVGSLIEYLEKQEI